MRLAPFALLLALAGTTVAEPPQDVLDFFRTAAEALADQDARGFLDHFDSNMEGFVTLQSEIEALSNADVRSTIEFAGDEGDDRKRELQLDWLLRVNGGRPRREIVRVRIEKQGKKWKIVSLRPVEFFGQP